MVSNSTASCIETKKSFGSKCFKIWQSLARNPNIKKQKLNRGLRILQHHKINRFQFAQNNTN